ncbi:MAG: GNAT family N-acetyltransferase [Lachnospiraceae bacterium]|nr:GNAT family N-acetyltransferase [Lachnospiraceae bacterium]
MEYKIVEYGSLNEFQKKQAVELFMEGFGHFMTFSKDEDLKRKLFLEIFHDSLFKCYVKEEKVLGLMGIATNKMRPLNFDYDLCIKYFGKLKGTILCKQMNAIFQTPVVKSENELYIDILVTGSKARRQGVGTALLNHAFEIEEYTVWSVEAFSNNQAAISLYEKNGFRIDKSKKISLMRFLGAGYPIRLRKSSGK